MFPVSDAFRAAARNSHKATLRAEVWSGGQKLITVEPVSGEVVADSRRAIRRTVHAEFAAEREIITPTVVNNSYAALKADYATYADVLAAASTYRQLIRVVGVETTSSPDPLVPGSGTGDPLSPYGNELRIWRGIVVQVEVPATYASLAATYVTYAALKAAVSTYGSLTEVESLVTITEEVPLGVFILTEVDVDDEGGPVRISVHGEDRARRISRNRWTSPYQVTSGTNAVTAITALLQDRWDDIEVVAASTSETVGAAVFGQETDNDPWKDAQKLAEAAGLDLYFDGEGRAVIAPIPSIEDATPDFTFSEGADGVLMKVSRSANAATTYNGIIVTGEGTSTDIPARGEAWDEDPTSPTYRHGPYGQVPRFYSSPFITTDAQAQAVAEAMLRKSLGLSEGLQWSLLPDPSVEAGDVAQVVSSAARVAKTLIIDSVTIPLNATGVMTAVGRTVSQVEVAS